MGALKNCRCLLLEVNQIGDDGMRSLADALAKGALPLLQKLLLPNNQIGDDGMIKLSEAVAMGAMASLQQLVVDEGPLGSEHPALKAACDARGIYVFGF